MSSFQVTDELEACGTSNSDALSEAFVCPVSFYWDLSRWLNLFDQDTTSASVTQLPVAGYYCAGVCAQFPTPAGYRMDKCQIVDIDECEAARVAQEPICAQYATCVNSKTRTASDSAPIEPAHGTLNTTGYLCICQAGYFTVQMFPTACEGSGLEVAYFMSEHVTSLHPVGPVASSNPDSNLDNGSTHAEAPAISAWYTLKIARMRVIAKIKELVPGVNDVVTIGVFAASSMFTDNSITYETAANTTVWKVTIRIASAFVQMDDSTLKQMAAVIRDTLVSETPQQFLLHTQKICTGPTGDGISLRDICAIDNECVLAGGGLCQVHVAYIQANLVQTNSDAISVDSQSAGFVLRSVKFDMASRVWILELQFLDRQDDTRRVLLLSKTRQMHGVKVFSERHDKVCATHATGGQITSDIQGLDGCFAGIADTFHVMQSFEDRFVTNTGMTPEQQQEIENGFLGYQDFSTGQFSTLASATAHETSYAQFEDAEAASEDSLLLTKTRQVFVTLTYDEVLNLVGRHTTHTERAMEVNVEFFVGMATMQVRNGKMSTVVATREILTRIGINHVLSHDITDEKLDDIVVPSIAVSLYNVYSRSDTASWGFISYHISLPRGAVAAGITFDVQDVIPVESVIGSIAFFQNDPVETNAYPCIFQPAADSYQTFAVKHGCSDSIRSVSLPIVLCCYVLPWRACLCLCSTLKSIFCNACDTLDDSVSRRRSANRCIQREIAGWSIHFLSGSTCWTERSIQTSSCS